MEAAASHDTGPLPNRHLRRRSLARENCEDATFPRLDVRAGAA